MRAVISNTSGGKVEPKVKYIKSKYKENKLMQDLIAVGRELKIHNLKLIMERVKAQYKGYFTKLKNGDKIAKPPRPKKLSKLNNYTILLDGFKSISLKRKNILGLNLANKMKYTHINFKEWLKIVGDLKNIKTININYKNNTIYLNVIYRSESKIISEAKPTKLSAIDIGINNLISLYIDDDYSDSIIISGIPYKTYNANFNRFIAKLNNEIAKSKDAKTIKKLSKYRTFLYEKRNRYFNDQFHKISKRVLEYLSKRGVTGLVISKSLSELKTNGNCKLNKATKQSFIQIPFIKLLNNIIQKAPKYGIAITEVDEAYTSKTSSLSADITEIQKLSKIRDLSTNDYKGSRVKRGLYKDKVLNKIINADLNGAKNILQIINKTKKKGEVGFKKLNNPIKVASDYDLLKLIA